MSSVIVSDEVGCHADLASDAVEGFFFLAGDVAAVTEALKKVLATPKITAEMGRRTRHRIENWNFEQNLRGLKQAIIEVTGRGL